MLEPQVGKTQDKDRNELDREAHGHVPRLDGLKAYRDRQQNDCARYRRLETRWSALRLIIFVDDLARNESYFLSEVRRLRRLVLDGEEDTPILGWIDEPFRGTNSQERTATGLALLEHLTASPNLLLIATRRPSWNAPAG